MQFSCLPYSTLGLVMLLHHHWDSTSEDQLSEKNIQMTKEVFPGVYKDWPHFFQEPLSVFECTYNF